MSASAAGGRVLLPFRVALLGEVVHRPVPTALVVRAGGSGRRVVDGSGTAAGHAHGSLRLPTGREPDGARVRAHLVELPAELPAEEAAACGERRVPGATTGV